MRAYAGVPPKRAGSCFESCVSSVASCSRVTPGFMRATMGPPPWPGRTWSSRMSVGTQSIVLSAGKAKSAGMTPMIVFVLSDTKYDLPITDGSRPNQLLHS